MISKSLIYPDYQGMSDQPDCCGSCGARLDLIRAKVVDEELVYVCQCLGCLREIWVVEMDDPISPDDAEDAEAVEPFQ